jgi:hypothetical protein
MISSSAALPPPPPVAAAVPTTAPGVELPKEINRLTPYRQIPMSD